jgi:hypothetical protein
MFSQTTICCPASESILHADKTAQIRVAKTSLFMLDLHAKWLPWQLQGPQCWASTQYNFSLFYVHDLTFFDMTNLFQHVFYFTVLMSVVSYARAKSTTSLLFNTNLHH